MVITIADLVPKSKEKIERETLFVSRHERPSFLEEIKKAPAPETAPNRKDQAPILNIPMETDLEKAITKILYSQEEISKANEERRRRISLCSAAAKNKWQKRIKSKVYRKVKREEKMKNEIQQMQIKSITEKNAENGLNGLDAIGDNINEQENKNKPPQIVPPEISIKQPKPLDIFLSFAKPVHTGIEEMLEIDKEFADEKRGAAEQDKPQEEEKVIPGWNTWGGESIEPKKTKYNTEKIKRTGIEIRKRKDFNSSHVIYNEKISKTRNPKYGIKKLPYGYKTEEEYQELLSFTLDASQQPLSLLNKILKDEKEM